MWSSNVVRSEHTPLRIEPECGKVGKDVGEPKRNVSLHVLEEDDADAGLVDDAPDVRPQVPLVVAPESFAGDAERLARVTGREPIHAATPCASVECSQVVPDRRAREIGSHVGHQDGRRERVALDVASRFQSESVSEPQLEPTDSGAKCQTIVHGSQGR